MKTVCSLSLLLVLFSAGCGKKKDAVKKPEHTKKIAALSGPDFVSDEKALLDNDEVSEFAFLNDDELDTDANLVASADQLDKAEKMKHEALSDAAHGENELLASSDDMSELGFKRVQFDFNKNKIRNDQLEAVDADIDAARKAVAQGKKVVVQGHTCQMGAAAYNLSLSQQRAEAVKHHMVKSGIDSDYVKTIGFGYEKPLVWSDKTERAEKIKELSPNRRAEVLVG